MRFVVLLSLLILTILTNCFSQNLHVRRFADDTSKVYIEAMYDTLYRLNGLYKEYYRTGQLKERSEYAQGMLQGESIVYYENGNIHKILNYEIIANEESNDSISLPDGLIKCYYDNGKLKAEGAIFNYCKKITTQQTNREDYGELVTLNLLNVFVKKKGMWRYFNKKGYLIGTEFYDENTSDWLSITDVEFPGKYYIKIKME